ncbi:MAG: 2-oxoglutarate dehydrogenase complex dihydrolipoyllysine-residue succinyltransferase [Gemmataceae bacterium]|nr:2-oxoglutarate dehydrogenase complex dihydrolipoyllysine-residue succinyltransferase [Gemmataceae bacterium]
MPAEIKVPSFGESITEGVLARWIKKDGEVVRRDEPVAEMESEKATSEVRSPASGRLKTTVPEGQTVPVGAVIAMIDESVTVPAAAPTAAPVATAIAPSKAEPAMSPAARIHAESRGVDPGRVAGSGRGGRIIKEDVLASTGPTSNGAATPVPASAPMVVRSGAREVRERMSPMRQRIAARLLESQQSTASLTTFNEADMTGINELRARYKDKFKEKHGIGLGFMSFFVKAAVEALKAFPAVNARIDGSEVVYQNFYSIGVAVSTPKGLVVPILKDADALTFAGVEAGIAALAVKARDGKLTVDDLQGGTFTITNGGVFGSMMSTPILNPPQTGILGMHAINKRPVVVNDQIVIRPMMYLALTYDHRLIDGRDAVQFLVRIKECVENPERLMLEV